MSTHLSRKELKQDNVALKVEETTHFLVTHGPLVKRVGGVIVVVLVIGLGSWFFMSSRRDAREQALAAALTMENAPVGAPPAGGGQSFATDAAKLEAVKKAFNTIITQDAGTEEAYAAEYYVAGSEVLGGKLEDALKKFDHVASSAGPDYSSLAKLSKAQVLLALNKASDAQAVLKDLIANPTAMVSKEEATIALAKSLAATQPDEARKLLTPIASQNSEISQAAVTALADIAQK